MNQLTEDAPRCRTCIDKENPAAVGFHAPIGWRRCSEHTVWCSGESFASPGALVCTACLEKQRATVERKEKQRATVDRKAQLPKFRIRDVQKHFGHRCEIPLQAYMEAGLGVHSRNCMVDKEDVQVNTRPSDDPAACQNDA